MASHTQQATRKRVIHQLDTPFSTVSWPEIHAGDQDTILELLCELLQPIGQHRRAHTKSSRGKRASKKESQAKRVDGPQPVVPAPPKPELASKIDVGFNSITTRLESSSRFRPKTEEPGEDETSLPYAMVFVARGNQSSAFNGHFPQMVGAASKHLPTDEKIRLIGFSKPCSDRLSNSLGIARVSSIAVTQDTPGAAALWDVVRKTVEPVDISWLDGAPDVQYRHTEIKATETTVGTKRVRQE